MESLPEIQRGDSRTIPAFFEKAVKSRRRWRVCGYRLPLSLHTLAVSDKDFFLPVVQQSDGHAKI
jgi:hypothetical protein